MAQIIYLAVPYTHHDPFVRQQRFERVTLAAARLMERGHIIYCPITMTHPIAEVMTDQSLKTNSDYWTEANEAFMEFCSEIYILMLDGWETSKGVHRETNYFAKRSRKITYVMPAEVGL